MWNGKVAPGRVLALVEHLHLNPYSRVRMISLGGDPRYIGWDANAELAADRFDQLTAIVASFSKNPVREDQRYPRPGAKPDDRDDAPVSDPRLFAESIDDFDPAAFMRVIAGR